MSRFKQLAGALCILITLFTVSSDSARILGLFSTPSKSHLIIHTAIVDALAERGHDVTVVTTIPLIKKNHRFRHIQVEIHQEGVENLLTKEINDPPPWYKKLTNMAEFLTDYAEKSLNQSKVRKLMDEESFDLVILGYFMNDVMLGIGAHFKCPVVVSFMVQPTNMLNYFVGNPNEAIYVPSLFLGAKQPMGFIDRLKNFLIVNVIEEIMNKLMSWYQEPVYIKMKTNPNFLSVPINIQTRSDHVAFARILGLFITPCKSHLIIHSAITKALADRGHNVTIVTTIPLLTNHPKYRHIQLQSLDIAPDYYSKLINSEPTWYEKIFQTTQAVNSYTNYSLNDPQMKKLMDEKSFDLIIYGYVFNDFLFGLQGHFKCPGIVSMAVRQVGSINGLVGNPQEVAYVPSLLSGNKQPLNFFERVTNFLYINFMEEVMLTMFCRWYQADVYSSNFPPDKYPSFDEVKKNISLVLTNHHFSQTPIRPNVPAMVEIGGIQIKEKPDPLPEDINGILDNSTKHGVVYFSLGSNVQGSFLDRSKVKIFFDVLSKLPQTILWKWGDAELPGISPNIIYKSWMPQDDVLSHKNIKLFITHAGQGSVVESQYHGVPMVGIPLFGEQSSNMENVVKDGFGLSVDYGTLNEKDFSNAVREVLTNQKYTDNVRRFAKLYKDRPMSAKETAVFWVEYVLRHHGAPHMQSPAVHLNKFQLASLDVIGFLLVVAYITLNILKILFSLIVGLIWKKKTKVD